MFQERIIETGGSEKHEELEQLLSEELVSRNHIVKSTQQIFVNVKDITWVVETLCLVQVEK